MSKITLIGWQQPEGLPEASITINISLEFGQDAPPALVEAIGKGIAEMLKAWGQDDELQRIAQECEEIRTRRQRHADHAAEMLLNGAYPASEAYPKGEPPEQLTRLCERCGKLRTDVTRTRYKDTDPEPEMRGSEEWLCASCYIGVVEQYNDAHNAPTSVEDPSA